MKEQEAATARLQAQGELAAVKEAAKARAEAQQRAAQAELDAEKRQSQRALVASEERRTKLELSYSHVREELQGAVEGARLLLVSQFGDLSVAELEDGVEEVDKDGEGKRPAGMYT